MRFTELAIPYVGADIVSELIERNSEKYASPTRVFVKLDLTSSPLPKCDLVVTRDCLDHLSFGDVSNALCNVKRRGAKYFAVTQFTQTISNRDQESGWVYRPIDFGMAPFKWPEPLVVVDEGTEPGKTLALWRVSDLP